MSEKLRQPQVINQDQVLDIKNGQFRINRRQFLKYAGAGLATIVLQNCGINSPSEAEGTKEVSTNTPEKTSTATVTKTQEVTKTIEATKTPEPTVTASVTPSPTSEINTNYSNRAVEKNGKVSLKNSDGKEVEIVIDAKGFIPDADLLVSDLQPKELGLMPKDAGDFQAYLNKKREGFKPLAGYIDGTNDYNQYGNHRSGPQVPAFGWMIHTGLSVEMKGIGKVVGEEGRSVMILIINRTERVYRFPTESVEVIAGFQGFGRIWDGEEKPFLETEKRLVNHYINRLGQGVPEVGFIGQCDGGNKECEAITVVTVERIQWGTNEDGTPRDQFRLLRAETVSAK